MLNRHDWRIQRRGGAVVKLYSSSSIERRGLCVGLVYVSALNELAHTIRTHHAISLEWCDKFENNSQKFEIHFPVAILLLPAQTIYI